MLSKKLPTHKRIKVFFLKTSLHFINHSIKSELGDVTIKKEFQNYLFFLIDIQEEKE